MWDDREAIARVAAGDAAGLEALYDRYATLVYSLALRIVRNTSDAEDVTQEAFAQEHPWFTVRKLPGVTHFAMIETPELVAEAIDEFVSRATAAR